MALVVRWKKVEFRSPFVNHLTLDLCIQYNSSRLCNSLIWSLWVASSIWLCRFGRLRIILRSVSFAFLSSTWLFPNPCFLHQIRLLRQLSNFKHMSASASHLSLQVQASRMTSLHSTVSNYISLNRKCLLPPCVRCRISDVWSDLIARSLVHCTSGFSVAHAELIRTWFIHLDTLSSPLRLLDHVDLDHFAPKSSIRISSIITLNSSICRWDFCQPPSFSWFWLITLKSPMQAHASLRPLPISLRSFQFCLRLWVL